MIPGLAVFKQATKEYPITKIVWPAIAIVAALAVIQSMKLGWDVILLGAPLILILILLFFIVSAIGVYLGGNPDRTTFRLPALFLVWAFSIGVAAFLALCMSCFFADYPKPLVQLFALGGQSTKSETQAATQPSPEIKSPEVNTVKPLTEGVPSASVEACADAIDVNSLSENEVLTQARNCLSIRGGK